MDINTELTGQLQDVTDRYAKLLQGRNPFDKSIERVDDMNILDTLSET